MGPAPVRITDSHPFPACVFVLVRVPGRLGAGGGEMRRAGTAETQRRRGKGWGPGFAGEIAKTGRELVPNHDIWFVTLAIITITACFAVAILSSHLAEQALRTRKELKAMGDRVRRVEKMAAVGEMGAGLAHEIKNPLASITGSIQLLREEIPFETGRDKLMQIILREADRLSALVGNFLLFARPPSGKSIPIELDSAIPETIRLIEQDRRFHNTVTIEQSGQNGLWIVMDPDHFRQILWNLLLNAVEAISGEGRVGVSMDNAKNGHVAIRISDDGCGISDAQMQSIFDPFYTSKPHGTGLGLSIVHSILESYEGWLEVDSRPGQGTHFTMKIKRIQPPLIT